jgi:hypothetical protein
MKSWNKKMQSSGHASDTQYQHWELPNMAQVCDESRLLLKHRSAVPLVSEVDFFRCFLLFRPAPVYVQPNALFVRLLYLTFLMHLSVSPFGDLQDL